MTIYIFFLIYLIILSILVNCLYLSITCTIKSSNILVKLRHKIKSLEIWRASTKNTNFS